MPQISANFLKFLFVFNSYLHSGGSVVKSPFIECSGRESCYNANLIGRSVSCDAKSACAEAHFGDTFGNFGEADSVESVVVSSYRGAESAFFDGVRYIEASGHESLYMAAVHSRGVPEMTVVLSGKHAGNMGTINCFSRFVISPFLFDKWFHFVS